MILDPDIDINDKEIIRRHIHMRKAQILLRHPEFFEKLMVKYMSDRMANEINKRIIDEIIEQRRTTVDPYYRKPQRGYVD